LRERIGSILTDEAEGEFEGTVDVMGNREIPSMVAGEGLK